MGKGAKSCWYEGGYINANCIGELLVLEKVLYVNALQEHSGATHPAQISGVCGKCAAKDTRERETD